MILIRIMRSLDRLSSSDQDCGDREMYIDLDDASVDSLTGKRTRHHVAEVSILFSLSFPFFFITFAATRVISLEVFKVPQAFVPSKKRYSTHIILYYRDRMIRFKFFRHHIFCSSTEFAIDSPRRDASRYGV